MPEADLVGAVLDGRYRVIEPIGQGAMGIVYRGERIKLGRAVAIKVLHDSLPHELAGRKRFELEARAMAQLEHPNCVAVLDVGLHEGRPYVVMDFVSGTDLRTLIGTNGRVAPERAVALVKQVLSGLAHAHELGIVHRDIKPANLMVGHKAGIGDQLKILDFGLARSLDAEQKSLTKGMVLGTPSYMAPEQCRGGTIDARTDLYAVGVLLFELLTGRKPFESAADDPVEVVGMHLHTAPPRLRDLVPDEEWGELETVVARALAKAPEERYASAAELATALDAAVAHNELTVPFEPLMMEDLAALVAAPAAAAPVAVPLAAAISGPVVAPGAAPAPVEAAPSGPHAVGIGSGPVATTGPRPLREPTPLPAPSSAPIPRVTPQSAPAVMPPASVEPPPSARPPSVVPPGALPPSAESVSLPPAAGFEEPPAVQRQRLRIAAGVVGAVLVLSVGLRLCTGGGGGSSAPDAAVARGDSSAPVAASGVPRDAAVQVSVVIPAVAPADAAPVPADAAPLGTPDDPAGAALLAAGARVSAQDIPGALKILSDAHRQFVANPDIPYMMGRLQLGRGQISEGLASLRSAVHLFPGYLEDPELARTVVHAFMSTPSRHAELARFLRTEIGRTAVPFLEEARDQATTPALRARAVAELKQIH